MARRAVARGSKTVRYRRSPHLVAHWRGSDPVVRNYATRVEVRASSIVFDVIEASEGWVTARALSARLGTSRASAETVGELEKLLDRLTVASILTRSDLKTHQSDAAMERWRGWNPAAGYFHGATKDLVFVEDDGLPWTPRGRSGGKPASSDGAGEPVFPGKVALTGPSTRGAVFRVLKQRRTWRRFSEAPLTQKDVSTLLWWTAGVQAWLHTPDGEKLSLKTSPSAGARHPIHLYVLARNVDGVSPGLYSYDGQRHQLHGIAGHEPSDIRQYLPRQSWYEGSAMVVFLCARFERTNARYPFPRAYRAIAAEAGHVGQTFCLAATSMGLAPFSTMALSEDAIDRALGLNGIDESVLYAVGVGRPDVSGVPSAPAGLTGARIRIRPLPRRCSR